MEATCLVNSYNYRRYVGEAVRSALEQTKPFAKVVVVDDGSKDGSQELLRREFGANSRVELLFKPNAGQLSCFNAGIDRVETDLVFFLDADDRYRPGYLEHALGVYRDRPEVDFLSVAPQAFGAGRVDPLRGPLPTRNLGLTVAGAALGGHWVGERTSCLSMKTAIARRILPCPHEQDWVSRADDVLVFGSSIAGAYKRHEEEPLVDYRLHEHNLFAGREFDALDSARRALTLNRLTNWLLGRCCLDRQSLSKMLHREFRTREQPTRRECRGYTKLALGSAAPWRMRLKQYFAITAHYVKPSAYAIKATRPQPAAPAPVPSKSAA